ncbi:ATP-binding SpoIIE family protein phosphatase [Pseudidiomarina sp.]|uniref:ATP-binding SpoIIE family protein phosphatase n=1 Tax=Pseudidiomarina sp. TaxID=2081707 RepID=UPI00299D2AC5|nr:ATP-binding SpoIIE family protein phosphatase [Pseudidiomarina sp.]MDX1706124.1 ATP-binding SpoIIE family protein phosphatase [Pseudidiomarina sp.]
MIEVSLAENRLKVIHDGSDLASEVLDALGKLPAGPATIRVLILAGANSEACDTIVESLQQEKARPRRRRTELLEPPVILLITDSSRRIEQCQGLVNDLILWPEPAGLLSHRVQVLRHWQDVRLELGMTRDALAWHANRIDREHQLVEHIFRNALSRNYLDYPNVKTYLTPVSKFNGDLCLIAPGPLGNIYMLLADFTGHGLAPATGALPLSQAFFAMSDRGVSVAEMVTEFNFRLNRLLPADMFCACFLLELSANGERVTYWNGGMPPALLFDCNGKILDRLHAQHMALGVLDENDFDSRVTTFRASADISIALYTDGVIELLGHKLEFLGGEALESLLKRFPEPEEFSEVVRELEHFRGEQPLHDDLSLAILQCCPTGLDEVKSASEDGSLPFVFESELEVSYLQRLEPVSHIVNSLSKLPSLRSHRTTIYLLLAEAYNNALEHGLLKLDSNLKRSPEGFAQYYQLRSERLSELEAGKVRIRIRFDADTERLEFTVTDNGEGWETELKAAQSQQSYGRGLELLKQLCRELRWQDDGREVVFTYQL